MTKTVKASLVNSIDFQIPKIVSVTFNSFCFPFAAWILNLCRSWTEKNQVRKLLPGLRQDRHGLHHIVLKWLDEKEEVEKPECTISMILRTVHKNNFEPNKLQFFHLFLFIQSVENSTYSFPKSTAFPKNSYTIQKKTRFVRDNGTKSTRNHIYKRSS